MILRRVDPNTLARERRELTDDSVRPSPVMVRLGDSVEAGVLYGWARADSGRSGKGLVLTIREFTAELQEEVLRWVPAASVGRVDSSQPEAWAQDHKALSTGGPGRDDPGRRRPPGDAAPECA